MCISICSARTRSGESAATPLDVSAMMITSDMGAFVVRYTVGGFGCPDC
jgi:hypothetical protein